MSNTRYLVGQTTVELHANLFMLPSLWGLKGEQFTVTLLVSVGRDEVLPLDIYVDRLDETATQGSAVNRDSVDGSIRIRTTASVSPGEVRFPLEFTLEPGQNHSSARPSVRVARRMLTLLLEREERHEQRVIDALLRDSGHA